MFMCVVPSIRLLWPVPGADGGESAGCTGSGVFGWLRNLDGGDEEEEVLLLLVFSEMDMVRVCPDGEGQWV